MFAGLKIERTAEPKGERVEPLTALLNSTLTESVKLYFMNNPFALDNETSCYTDFGPFPATGSHQGEGTVPFPGGCRFTLELP